jgi:hypothetical protein
MSAPFQAQLHAKRLSADVRVPLDHPAPELARRVVADEVAGRVPDALGAALENVLRADDGGVWLIRRLEVDVHLRRDGDAGQLAGVWAREIALALRRLMDGEGDPANVIRFRSRGEHLAGFLGDLLDGGAHDRWYHGSFEGLRAMPLSAALRTALERDRADAVDALRVLSEPVRQRLVAAVTEPDANRLVSLLVDAEPTVTRERVLEVLALAWQARVGRAAALGEPRLRLTLLLRCLELEAEALDGRLAPLVAALVRVRMRIAEARGEAMGRLDALLTGDAGTLARTWRVDDLPVILPLLRERVDWLAPVLSEMAAGTEDAPPARRERSSLYTPFGGAALLLPVAVSIAWEGLRAPKSPWPELPAQAWLRFVAILEALGGPARQHGLDDPVLRALYGIDAALHTPARIRSRSPLRTESAAASRLLRAFAARLRGFSRSGDEHLRQNFLDVDARLEVDDGGRWLVHVGRPPLHVVLHMAGLDRQDVWVPWLERSVSIFPDDEG